MKLWFMLGITLMPPAHWSWPWYSKFFTLAKYYMFCGLKWSNVDGHKGASQRDKFLRAVSRRCVKIVTQRRNTSTYIGNIRAAYSVARTAGSNWRATHWIKSFQLSMVQIISEWRTYTQWDPQCTAEGGSALWCHIIGEKSMPLSGMNPLVSWSQLTNRLGIPFEHIDNIVV